MKTFKQIIQILEAKSEQEHYQNVFKSEFEKARKAGQSVSDAETSAKKIARRAKLRRTGRLATQKYMTNLRDEPKKWKEMVQKYGEMKYT